VGRCEPELVARAIRRGVISAETKTGAPKPVLLCLMGAAGVVDFTFEGKGAVADRKTMFPSYRFPEAAARALAHAVAYASYRGQPLGRLIWHEDVDVAGARSRLEAALAGVAADAGPRWVTREQAREILACFGITVAGGKKPSGRERIEVSVRPHPVFGPVLDLRSRDAAVERITPLTDEDVRVMLDAVGVAPDGKEPELLCRLSQLVEEMPWLVELHAELVPAGAGEASRAALGGELRIAFAPPTGTAPVL
jgi:hypothetical protein